MIRISYACSERMVWRSLEVRRARRPRRPSLARTVIASARLVLVPFSTRLPPQLLERLRIAAPQLGLRQGEIAARAIDRFLGEHGF
jgi:hypothetical protein